MTDYFDSSVLVAVYVNEANSKRARAEVRTRLPIPWTLLHDLEVRNALRLLHGRSLIDAPELHVLLGHLDDDLEKGRLDRSPLDLGAVFRRAGRLSQSHTSTTLARTLDILHVAALLELGSTRLISADDRQLALARAEGIRTTDIRGGR